MLIVKTGTTLAPLRERFGDFEDWIAAGLGIPRERVDTRAVYLDEPLPQPEAVAGIVVTGSPAMVSACEAWSERTAAWLAEALAADRPVLGLCYGHQLMAHALGGEVGPNPKGRGMGTVPVELAETGRSDALLGVLPHRSRLHVTHEEAVLSPPAGAQVLATAPHDAYHALRYGPRAWGVQFHPEFDAAVMRGYIEQRANILADEGIDAERLRSQVQTTPWGTRLLRRFAAAAM